MYVITVISHTVEALQDNFTLMYQFYVSARLDKRQSYLHISSVDNSSPICTFEA